MPTSARISALAQEEGIPLVTLSEARPLFTIDGADEIGPGLALIKGRGGVLLREKIVAAAGDGLVVIADETKLVDSLGTGSLPVEIEPFGYETTLEDLSSLGCEPTLRLQGPPEQATRSTPTSPMETTTPPTASSPMASLTRRRSKGR
ncbi:MAG TPA: ribose-5-phosphate isomerase A [Rubrobacter sp.]|nr:ribose-5-phosphate isomerase A [Rubrobacter sp.]